MARTNPKVSGAEFLKRLQDPASLPVVMTGIVRASEEDKGALMFARPGNCSHWVSVPADMVDHVQPLGTVACQGHVHHLAELHLKRPSSPEAQTFANLAQLHALSVQPAAMLTPATSGIISCPGGAQPYWDAQQGVWRCP